MTLFPEGCYVRRFDMGVGVVTRTKPGNIEGLFEVDFGPPYGTRWCSAVHLAPATEREWAAWQAALALGVQP